MLNEKKITFMANAASFEQGVDKKNLEIAQYFRGDYISIQMLKASVAYTVSFGILGFLWAGEKIEGLLLQLSRVDYMGRLLKWVFLFYVAGLIIYEAATYFYFSVRYRRAKDYAAKYYKQLKKLSDFYEAQEAAEASAAEAGNRMEKEETL